MKARFIVLWAEPTDKEAFDDHYWNVHIPLSKKLPNLRSYTVSRNLSRVRGGEPCYIVGELEWNSMEDLRKDFQSAEGRATADDVAKLSQWSPGVRSMIYEAEEVCDHSDQGG